MKVISLQPLSQFGFPVYKGVEIDIPDKKAKELIKSGFVKSIGDIKEEDEQFKDFTDEDLRDELTKADVSFHPNLGRKKLIIAVEKLREK